MITNHKTTKMKKYVLSALLAVMTAVGANAQQDGYSMLIEKHNGSKIAVAVNDVKQVSFVNGDTVIDGEDLQTIVRKLDRLSQRIDSLANAMKNPVSSMVRINPTTETWEISNDGGKTWANTGVKARGQDGKDGRNGDSFFESITYTSDATGQYLLMVLSSGVTFKVPLAN